MHHRRDTGRLAPTQTRRKTTIEKSNKKREGGRQNKNKIAVEHANPLRSQRLRGRRGIGSNQQLRTEAGAPATAVATPGTPAETAETAVAEEARRRARIRKSSRMGTTTSSFKSRSSRSSSNSNKSVRRNFNRSTVLHARCTTAAAFYTAKPPSPAFACKPEKTELCFIETGGRP